MRTHAPSPATSPRDPSLRGLHRGGSGWTWLAMGAILVLPTACDTPPPNGQAPDPGAEAPAPPDEGIQLSAGIGSLAFAPGDSMRVVLQLSNRLAQPRSLLFHTAQRYELQLVDSDDAVVYSWSDGRAFAQVQEEVELPAGNSGPEWVEWLPLDLPEGSYLLRARIPVPEADLEAELPFEVRGQAAGGG